MLLRLGLWFSGCICRQMIQSMLSCFLWDSHVCLAMKRKVPFREDFRYIQACVHAFAQSTTLPSQQNCRCRKKGSVRPSCCGLINSLPYFGSGSLIYNWSYWAMLVWAGKIQQGIVGWLLSAHISSSLSLMHCPSPFLILSLHSGCCVFPRKSLDMSPGTSLQS